jgi:hypothetical protein
VKGKEKSRRKADAFQDFLSRYFAFQTSRKLHVPVVGAVGEEGLELTALTYVPSG